MKWILQTKSHSVKENSDKDLQFFLDIDMAVLGRPSEGKKMKCLSIWLFSFRAKANQLNVNFYGMRLNCFHYHYCLKPVFFQTTRSMQIRFVKNTAIYLIRNTKSADQRYVHLKCVEWFCMLGYRDVLKWSSLSERSLTIKLKVSAQYKWFRCCFDVSITQVLRGFCQRQRIFATDEFHEFYHDIAIKNLEKEKLCLENWFPLLKISVFYIHVHGLVIYFVQCTFFSY